ncbi:MAG TPA: hypothetical protein EYN70_06635, partial [Planctomycetaceae bacterium]|nr:hypothetical protein [Planctomycetaceae bacterium]
MNRIAHSPRSPSVPWQQLLVVLTVVGSAISTVRAAEQPNILFVFTDDHAYQSISAYGSRINQTPNMDRIAREGVRFDNCYVTNSICGPMRAAILTGKYSHINGFMVNGNRFDGSQQTFPKLIQGAGYQTAIVGKWHLSSQPTGFKIGNTGTYHCRHSFPDIFAR